MQRFDSVCVLGGAGLVGYQVCRRLLRDGVTRRLSVISLRRNEVQRAVADLREEFPEAELVGRYGNLFARGCLADGDTEAVASVPDRRDPAQRRELLADIYEDFEDARDHSAVTALMRELKPAAVVDCINTATAISYQDVPTAAKRLMADLGLRGTAKSADHLQEDVEGLLASIEVPQLILHVRLLHEALTEAGTEVYVKVGTTGTGGMGLNIPYTHGEDKPSPTLMAKTAVAFAHTGLLFLAARTEGGPVFKELKPAAMVGYRQVAVHEVPGYVWEREGDRFAKRYALARPLYQARAAALDEALDTRPDTSAFEVCQDADGKPRTLRLACVNTGENGWFAHGEFEAITALDQMEMITPEEIARATVQELGGLSTGTDVLAALDASILGPTYKGGLLRQVALDRILEIEVEGSVPSIAIGDLGPPQLSKYLFELYLMRAAYEMLEAAAVGLRGPDAGQRLEQVLEQRPDLRDAIVSVGIPILLPDGQTYLRGPEIKIPGYDPGEKPRPATPAEIDAYAAKGWVDLRARNLLRWADRLDHVVGSRRGGSAGASDAMGQESYGRDDFRIGEVVAWVFANEPEFRGFRIK
ncbi:MAG: hypothetical protein ACYTEZ_12190 [Planctomycetota bacterium]|jgi:hypothetical protein